MTRVLAPVRAAAMAAMAPAVPPPATTTSYVLRDLTELYSSRCTAFAAPFSLHGPVSPIPGRNPAGAGTGHELGLPAGRGKDMIGSATAVALSRGRAHSDRPGGSPGPPPRRRPPAPRRHTPG